MGKTGISEQGRTIDAISRWEGIYGEKGHL
jgi:hypothetical protein